MRTLILATLIACVPGLLSAQRLPVPIVKRNAKAPHDACFSFYERRSCFDSSTRPLTAAHPRRQCTSLSAKFAWPIAAAALGGFAGAVTSLVRAAGTWEPQSDRLMYVGAGMGAAFGIAATWPKPTCPARGAE